MTRDGFAERMCGVRQFFIGEGVEDVRCLSMVRFCEHARNVKGVLRLKLPAANPVHLCRGAMQ